MEGKSGAYSPANSHQMLQKMGKFGIRVLHRPVAAPRRSFAWDSASESLALRRFYEMEYAVRRAAEDPEDLSENWDSCENYFKSIGFRTKVPPTMHQLILTRTLGDTKVTVRLDALPMNVDPERQQTDDQKLSPDENGTADAIEQEIAEEVENRKGVDIDFLSDFVVVVESPNNSKMSFRVASCNGSIRLKWFFPGEVIGKEVPLEYNGDYFNPMEFHMETHVLEFLRVFGIDPKFANAAATTQMLLTPLAEQRLIKMMAEFFD